MVPLFLKHPDADRLARRVARITGETLTQAIVTALAERLDRLEAKRKGRSLADDLRDIGERCAARPVLDPKAADPVAYDRQGLPR
jgi:antitoxin VapB